MIFYSCKLFPKANEKAYLVQVPKSTCRFIGVSGYLWYKNRTIDCTKSFFPFLSAFFPPLCFSFFWDSADLTEDRNKIEGFFMIDFRAALLADIASSFFRRERDLRSCASRAKIPVLGVLSGKDD
jgi:hypothetical protein